MNATLRPMEPVEARRAFLRRFSELVTRKRSRFIGWRLLEVRLAAGSISGISTRRVTIPSVVSAPS